MADIGRLIIFAGLVLVVIGAMVWGLGRMGYRGLPGDISYESPSGSFRFYFPIVTCLLLSVLLTLAMWLWRWLSGR